MKLLLFVGNNCPACRSLEAKLRSLHVNNLEIINVEEDTAKAQRYVIMSVPTLLKVEEGGFKRVIDMIIGDVGIAKLKYFI